MALTLAQQQAIAMASARSRAALAAPPPDTSAPNPILDAVRSVPGGLAKGAASLAGLPGDLHDLELGGLNWLATKAGLGDAAPHPSILPTSQNLNDLASAPTGGYYIPKTDAGRFAETAASFAPAVIGGPESVGARILQRAILPAAGATIGKDIGGDTGELVGTVAGALAPTGLRAVASLGGRTLTHALGATTGAGATAVRGAFDAGRAGGAADTAFTSNLRDSTNWDQVVTDAKDALANMRADRGAAYRSGMANVRNDPTVLDFKPIDAAVTRTAGVKTFKGQDLSPMTADVRSQINDTIDHWRNLDPTQYHTPEGFDALKQKIGDIRDAQPYGSPQRAIADPIYSAVRTTIAAQAPAYGKVMGNYSKASDLLDTIQRELSLGPKGNPNTALRKLQSVMRDNANTSWGQRANLAQTLSDNGASTLMPSLAGQSLSAVLPRGLARYGDIGVAAAAAAAHNPAALAMLPAASPRVVGEAARAAGVATRLMSGAARSVPGASGLFGAAASIPASARQRLINAVPALGILSAPMLANVTN